MAARLVHNSLGPMAHKAKGMRWRIQGVCLRSDRRVCARGCAPGTNGQWLAKRCHLPFLGMRRVCAGYKKFNWPPWLILGLAQRSRQENRSKEPKGCAGQYAPEGIRWIQKVNGSPTDASCHFWVCAGYALGTKNPPPTLLILGLAHRSRQRVQASLQNVRIINLGFCAGGMRRIYIYIYTKK